MLTEATHNTKREVSYSFSRILPWADPRSCGLAPFYI